MNYKIVTIALLLASSVALANDSWACVEMSSTRNAEGIMACGIGTAATEEVAREEAFKRAHSEFNLVCKNSDDCKDHSVMIDPKRTSCKKDRHGFKCYRAVQFIIKELKVLQEEVKVVEQKVKEVDDRITFKVKALIAKQEQSVTGIKKGMDVEDVIATLGNPYVHFKNGAGEDILAYEKNSPFCIAGSCVLKFHPKTGKLYKWENVSKHYIANN